MLAKKYKLPIQLFRNKKTQQIFRGRHFFVKVFQNNKEDNFQFPIRFGIIVSKKVLKKATARNALKRDVFCFLEEISEKLPKADYLIITKPSAARASKTEIRKDLFNLCQRFFTL